MFDMNLNYIELIRQNKLSYSTIDSLAKKLATFTKEAEIDVKNNIISLIQDGSLFLDNKNKVSI